MNFIEKCIAGVTEPDKIDDFINLWYDDNANSQDLFEYLGMTHSEYGAWVIGKMEVDDILNNRK